MPIFKSRMRIVRAGFFRALPGGLQSQVSLEKICKDPPQRITEKHKNSLFSSVLLCVLCGVFFEILASDDFAVRLRALPFPWIFWWPERTLRVRREPRFFWGFLSMADN